MSHMGDCVMLYPYVDVEIVSLVEGVSSLSEDGSGTGMAGDGAEDHSGGLGTVTFLK